MKAICPIGGVFLLVIWIYGCGDELPTPDSSKTALKPELKQTHDIAVTGVSVPSTCVQGDTVSVVVSVKNQGNCRESVEVTLTDIATGLEIGTQKVMLSSTGEGGINPVPDLVLMGENPGDTFGSYNFAGDVNGDGYDDLAVGASRYNNNQGRVYLYFGGRDMDGVPDIVLTGENPGDYFGEVGPIGDFNGDGYDDVIVGAPGYKDFQGRVYVYYSGPHMDHNADLTLDGETVQSRFGRSIAVGDINNDEYEDVFVAATYYNNLTGRVYLYYGGNPMDTKPDKIFDGEQEGELFGRCLYHQNKIADVDGDGYRDIVISSRHWNETQGRAYLYYGGPGTSMDTIPDVVFTGESIGDDFGVCAALFDIDNDGYADVLIGARKWPSGSMQGRVYLYWGCDRETFDNVPNFTFTGEADASATFGGDCVVAGYVNDDKYGDIIVTAYDYYRFCQHGRTYLFYGNTKSSIDNVYDQTFTGEEPGNLIIKAATADFDGDNCGDMVVSGPWGPNWARQGRVWLYYSEHQYSNDVTFDWDTKNTSIGDHVLTVKVTPVAGDEDTAENTKSITVNVKADGTDWKREPHQENLQKRQEISKVARKTISEGAEKPNSSLTLAAVDGDMHQVELHLDRGTDINEKTISGDTALHYAIKYGHREVAELLIAKGADINSKNRDGEIPAHLSIKTNQREILDLLIAKGASVSPTHLAAYKGDLAAVRESINRKRTSINAADEGGLTLLQAAASGGQKDVVEYLLVQGAEVNVYDKKQQTPLFCAASAGHKEVVELLITKGADVNHARNPDCWTPLYAAVHAGHKDVVALLISKGGDVNSKSLTGDTPLHTATLQGDRDLAELLIVKGADLNAGNARWANTPLHLAVTSGQKNVVELLVTKGASLDVRNSDGFTPLHYVASRRRLSWWETLIGDSSNPNDMAIAQLLITNGADVNARDDQGQTPLRFAKRRGNKEIFELLRKHGAE